MATWVAIKFFYATMLGLTDSVLTTSEVAATGDYDVDYIYNMLEVGSILTANANDQHIEYDAGVGNTETADYLVIHGHNLFTADALVSLEYSDAGDWTGEETVVVAAFTPTSDGVVLKEFTKTTAHRYWRLKLTSLSEAPLITLCIWGNKTELDLARSSYDPLSFQEQTTVNLTTGGVTAGIHEAYVEREFSISYPKMTDEIYQKLLAWRETSGAQQIFVAWETANNPDDVFLVYPVGRFHCPFVVGGLYRSTTLNFKGRKAT